MGLLALVTLMKLLCWRVPIIASKFFCVLMMYRDSDPSGCLTD